MIPYYPQPVLHVGPLTIHAFGALAAAAAVIGGWVILRRARQKGIPAEEMFRFCFWVYISALIGAVFAKTALDGYPEILHHPLQAFRLNQGVRSSGGIGAGCFAGVAWCLYHRLSIYETLRRLDVVAFGIPLAWMIGRLGCALAHDHRGLPSTSWIAVKFPEGSRYDLGLIEFLFLIGMVACFYYLDRQPRPVGFFLGLYGVMYGGFRIWLDTLHIQPLRFYEGMAGVALGLLAWIAMWRLRGQNVTNPPFPPPVPADR